MGTFLILLGLIVIFFVISLRQVPADPPHIAVVTLLGQRLRKTKREGYRLFPFYPVICSAILVDITKKNQDLPPQIVRSRDLAEIEVNVSLTWTPDPDHAIEYLNHGGENGIKTILSDIVRERLRELSISIDWEDVLRAHDEVTAILIQDVAGLQPYPKEQQVEIIRKIRQGDGVQSIPQLGITLNRLNIGEIRPKGELVCAAEVLVKEERERKGEKIEIAHVLEQVQKIKQLLNVTNEQAIELAQTERGKVSKKINEMKVSVSGETVEMIEKIVDRIWQKRK